MELRVEANTQKILDLFSRRNVSATFFITGWVADKVPGLVTRIAEAGHDIGCHSYWHRKVYDLTPDEFLEDTVKATRILEKYSGKNISVYRAPSYSITKRSLWAFDILESLGFTADSSVYPIYHDMYGIPDAPRFAYDISGKNIREYPISTASIIGKNIPVGGGGYFRLYPYVFTRRALRYINTKEKQPFVFYFHPWEIDPGQPRVKNLSLFSNFRHYNNLDRTWSRLNRLLDDFNFQPIPTRGDNLSCEYL